MATRETRAFFQRLCECGEIFGRHGAAPPHTRGDACPGFRPVKPETKEQDRG